MKPIIHAIAAAFALVLAAPAIGQYEGEIEIPDHVLEAIREFNEREPGAPNEVIVILDPPTAEEPPGKSAAGETADQEAIDDVVASILANEEETEPAEPAPHGPEVRVQALRDPGATNIQAEDIKINAPFAAKPLGRPSNGWKLVSSPNVEAFTKNVEVTPGTWLTLSIRPHVLVPEADGQSVFQIREPGFDPALGYKQASTISASIASSLRQLEDDSQLLGQVIDDLEQILISLPRPAKIGP
jgi:hypothetical protein